MRFVFGGFFRDHGRTNLKAIEWGSLTLSKLQNSQGSLFQFLRENSRNRSVPYLSRFTVPGPRTQEVQADQTLPIGRIGNPESMDHPKDQPLCLVDWTPREKQTHHPKPRTDGPFRSFDDFFLIKDWR